MTWTLIAEKTEIKTTTGTTSPINTTGADLIVVAVSQQQTPVAVLTDSFSNTYTSLPAQQEPTPIAIFNSSQTNSEIALTGGDLIATKNTTATNGIACCSSSFSTGLVYWETEVSFSAAANAGVGVANSASSVATNDWLGDVADSFGWYANGHVYNNGSQIATWDAYTSGQTVAIALDLTHNMIWGRVGAAGNWNSNGSANPATNTGGVSLNSSIYASPVVPAISMYNITLPDSATANFGASTFVGTVPSGFTAVGGNGGGTRCQLFYCQGGTVGSGHTFTLTAGSAFLGAIQVYAFSGSGENPLDFQVGSSTTSNVTSFSPGTITSTFEKSLAITVLSTGSPSIDASGGSLVIEDENTSFFPTPSYENYTASVNVGLAVSYATNAGPFFPTNGTWSWPTPHTPASAVMAIFQPKYSQKTSVWTSTGAITLTDAETCIIYDSSSAGALEIPTDASVYFQIGTKIEWIQKGSGILTVEAVDSMTTNVITTGITFNGTSTISGFIRKIAANEWVVGSYQ